MRNVLPDWADRIAQVNNLNIQAWVTHLSEKNPCTRMFQQGYENRRNKNHCSYFYLLWKPFCKIQNNFTIRISDQEKQVLPVSWSLKTKTYGPEKPNTLEDPMAKRAGGPPNLEDQMPRRAGGPPKLKDQITWRAGGPTAQED